MCIKQIDPAFTGFSLMKRRAVQLDRLGKGQLGPMMTTLEYLAGQEGAKGIYPQARRREDNH